MLSHDTLRRAFVIVLVGIALGIGFNLASPRKVPWKAVKKQVASLEEAAPPTAGVPEAEAATPEALPPGHDPGDAYADITESEFPREVSLEKAKELYDRGGLLVLDVREETEYAMGHIKGAAHAPHDEKVGDVEWLDSTAARAAPYLVYCDGGDCELSLNLGFALCESGHRRVLILKEGYAAWEEAGYPTSTGDLP